MNIQSRARKKREKKIHIQYANKELCKKINRLEQVHLLSPSTFTLLLQRHIVTDETRQEQMHRECESHSQHINSAEPC